MLRCPEQAEHTPCPTGRRAGEIRDSIVRVVPQQPRSRHSTDRVRRLSVEISWCRRERAARRGGYKRRPGPAGWPRSPAHNWTELRSARRVLSVLPDRRRKRRQMRMCASWRMPGTETAKWSPRGRQERGERNAARNGRPIDRRQQHRQRAFQTSAAHTLSAARSRFPIKVAPTPDRSAHPDQPQQEAAGRPAQRRTR
jgi:hypothetical protein